MKITLKIPDETKTLWRSLWHNRWLRYSVYALGITIPLGIYAAALISIPHTFVGGQLVRAGEVNTNFKTLYDTLGITEAKGLTVGANIEAQGFTLNGTPVGSSSDSFWSVAGSPNIAYNGGNVGIGITPTTTFHVNGTTTLAGATAINGDTVMKGSTSAAGAAALNVKNSGGTSLLYVGNDGKVGLGTTSPTGFLHIVGDTTTIQMKVEQLNTGSYNASLSLHQSGNAAGREWRLTSMNNGGFKIRDKTASADRFLIDTSGNVGIGTTSPGSELEIKSAGSPEIRLRSPNTYTQIVQTDGGGGNDALIDLSPIPATTADNVLIRLFRTTDTTGGGSAQLLILKGDNSATASHRLIGSGNALFAVDGIGRVGVRNSSPVYTLDVTGDVNTSDCYREGGLPIAGTCSSDRRLKKDIYYLTNSLSKIMLLQPASFKWRVKEFPTRKLFKGREEGLIAQDIEKVFPNLVVTGKDSYKKIRYNLTLQMHTIQALRELNVKVTDQNKELKTKNAQLEAALTAQNARLDRIERLMARAN